MKKEIVVGSYEYQELKDGSTMTSSSGICTHFWNELIKKNKLMHKELEIVLRVKK